MSTLNSGLMESTVKWCKNIIWDLFMQFVVTIVQLLVYWLRKYTHKFYVICVKKIEIYERLSHSNSSNVCVIWKDISITHGNYVNLFSIGIL